MAAQDIWGNPAEGATCAIGGEAVTPNDSADLTYVSRGLMVTVAGNVAVTMKDGSAVTLPALQPGIVYPVRVSRVKATNTTATGIVSLY